MKTFFKVLAVICFILAGLLLGEYVGDPELQNPDNFVCMIGFFLFSLAFYIIGKQLRA